ncbi:hypothetical protein JRQ81_011409 [Phrynocephalus forsythii]|uniref:Myb-like domain-containing protein n=1 Tax=Phrynocephalus forsythii TaxID=171643 RepID=A0A9Q1AQ60_9SAUR|nr:hypothetical protein JRQ81_011409 [Phrynocephalus forsythii]
MRRWERAEEEAEAALQCSKAAAAAAAAAAEHPRLGTLFASSPCDPPARLAGVRGGGDACLSCGRRPKSGAAAPPPPGMPGESEETTRLRKPRFSYEENQVLIREVRANYAKLYGAQSRRVTVAERRRVWEGIAAKINSLTSWKRTGQEVQKRWNDFKRRTKEKLARVPHSTQGAGVGGVGVGGPGGDETFSAEEETIFAILGPGVVMGAGGGGGGGGGVGTVGAEPSSAGQSTSPTPTPPGYRWAAEPGTDMPTRAHVSCSPEIPAHRLSCYPPDGGLLRPKERDSPAPPPGPPTSLQIVQLAPSPASLGATGCHPMPFHIAAATAPAHLPRPPGESPLDFLEAQRETAEAIRELTYTLRQGLERLTDMVAALLPLLPAPTNGLLPLQEGVPLPAPPHSLETLLPRDAFTAKAEPSLEQGENEARTAGDEGPPVAEAAASPTRSPPPQKGRKGVPTRKRRGRWKNLTRAGKGRLHVSLRRQGRADFPVKPAPQGDLGCRPWSMQVLAMMKPGPASPRILPIRTRLSPQLPAKQQPLPGLCDPRKTTEPSAHLRKNDQPPSLQALGQRPYLNRKQGLSPGEQKCRGSSGGTPENPKRGAALGPSTRKVSDAYTSKEEGWNVNRSILKMGTAEQEKMVITGSMPISTQRDIQISAHADIQLLLQTPSVAFLSARAPCASSSSSSSSSSPLSASLIAKTTPPSRLCRRSYVSFSM